jgi:hypothetical protein
MFNSHNNPQLWKKIDYVTHRNILTRVYKNQNTKDFQSNVQAYFNSWFMCSENFKQRLY